MCSLKHKVKVTKFCIGREELINVNKLTKFDLCIINGLRETNLNATAKRKLLTPDRRTDRQTDGQTDRRFSQILRPDLLCNPVKNLPRLPLDPITAPNPSCSRQISLTYKIIYSPSFQIPFTHRILGLMCHHFKTQNTVYCVRKRKYMQCVIGTYAVLYGCFFKYSVVSDFIV